jgi:hypothetical protein
MRTWRLLRRLYFINAEDAEVHRKRRPQLLKWHMGPNERYLATNAHTVELSPVWSVPATKKDNGSNVPWRSLTTNHIWATPTWNRIHRFQLRDSPINPQVLGVICMNCSQYLAAFLPRRWCRMVSRSKYELAPGSLVPPHKYQLPNCGFAYHRHLRPSHTTKNSFVKSRQCSV